MIKSDLSILEADFTVANKTLSEWLAWAKHENRAREHLRQRERTVMVQSRDFGPVWVYLNATYTDLTHAVKWRSKGKRKEIYEFSFVAQGNGRKVAKERAQQLRDWLADYKRKPHD